MFRLLALLIALSLGAVSSVENLGDGICGPHGITGVSPEESPGVPVDSPTSNVTEEMFNAILDHIEELYTPVVAKAGGKLQVVRKWEDKTVNAYAQQRSGNWIITMFGGLARHRTVTPDAVRFGCLSRAGASLGRSSEKEGLAVQRGAVRLLCHE